MLLLRELAYRGADRIYKAIVASTHREKILKPILRPYDSVGSTRYVDFDTVRNVYETRPDKCHINRVVADAESWSRNWPRPWRTWKKSSATPRTIMSASPSRKHAERRGRELQAGLYRAAQ